MMKKELTLILLFLSSLTVFSQPSRDTLEHYIVPLNFHTPTGSFKKGKGACVDTLDIADGRLLLVLRDDNTWYYIKNQSKVSEDQVFKEAWIINSINPYGRISLSDMPFRTSICLVDSASNFTCPYLGKIFSKFGFRHGRRHQGVDLPLSTGTPVVAAFDGRVRVASYCSGYGNLVVVRHENGLETYYGHLSRFMVVPGQWVRAGEVVGAGGSTGRTTGPHLHFETRYRGFAFDPQWIINFQTGTLRANVFVLLRSYLNASSQYTQQTLSEEDDIYSGVEQAMSKEKRSSEDALAAKDAAQYHRVRSGETVSAICRKYGVSQKTVAKLNPNVNLNKIHIGQKIRVN